MSENNRATERSQAETWGKAEPWAHWLGRLCFVFMIGSMAMNGLYLIKPLVGLIANPLGSSAIRILKVVWYSVQIGMVLVCLIMYGIKFSNICKEFDWEATISEVIHFGDLRVPKMIFFGTIAAVFGSGFGGAGLIVPAVLILNLGPVTMQWREGTKK